MEKVNYLKLAELYTSFLVAVGGVSITALTLVLSLDWKSRNTNGAGEGNPLAFLVAALVVATVCCFIGAHMMAETAAFLEYGRNATPPLSGERPFLLASTNIFMATVLVLFALMLLPLASRDKQAVRITPISILVFGSIVFATIIWMFRAAMYRMPPPGGFIIIARGVIISIVGGIILYYVLVSRKRIQWKPLKLIPRNLLLPDRKVRDRRLLKATFIPIIFFTAISLAYFTFIFGDGGRVHDIDIFFFSLAVTTSYAALIVASVRTMRGNKADNIKQQETQPPHDNSASQTP